MRGEAMFAREMVTGRQLRPLRLSDIDLSFATPGGHAIETRVFYFGRGTLRAGPIDVAADRCARGLRPISATGRWHSCGRRDRSRRLALRPSHEARGRRAVRNRRFTDSEPMLDRQLLRDNLRIAPEQPATALWRAIEIGHLLRRTALPVNGRGLDLGCGNGRVTGLVRDRSRARWELVGVDPDPREVALARESGIYEAVHEVDGRLHPSR